jgi:hypothetical protein
VAAAQGRARGQGGAGGWQPDVQQARCGALGLICRMLVLETLLLPLSVLLGFFLSDAVLC